MAWQLQNSNASLSGKTHHSTSWRNYTPALVQSRSMALAGKMARPMVNHQGVYL